jgi:hypothetical protein
MVHQITSKHVPSSSAEKTRRGKAYDKAKLQATKQAATATHGGHHEAAEVPEAAPQVTGATKSDERQRMIEVAAYFRAEHRHFEAGHELDDWFEGEDEIDRIYVGGGASGKRTS